MNQPPSLAQFSDEEARFNNGINERLNRIEELDLILHNQFRDVIRIDKSLSRQIVSFQANKNEACYRWYKYKESFSSVLVKSLLNFYNIPKGCIFDPFAGIGTTLFSSISEGYDAEGIELLPCSQLIINTRIITDNLSAKDIKRLIHWNVHRPWENVNREEVINELRITSGAYSEITKKSIGKFLYSIKKERNNVKAVLLLALLCILESVSYTRKDGQYLRWDYRSGRQKEKNNFNKGKIYDFNYAFTQKLQEIIGDLDSTDLQGNLFNKHKITKGKVKLYNGSCLEVMPELNSSFDAIITSPPYCNRYDYTRTYALELALLGLTESELINLRQQMISCTVENREKKLLAINKNWEKPIKISNDNGLLQAIIKYLNYKKQNKELNNNGIPRMVKGYFYEMSCVIQECYRLLKPGGRMFMVNDNVRYAGVRISVDLILSSIAEKLGFFIENILVLPQSKGNSSQQMGKHGREELRKCVYIWRKPI